MAAVSDVLRHKDGAPATADFFSSSGAPLVLNDDTGSLYTQTDASVIVQVGGAARAAVAQQTGFAADTYLTNSSLVIPPSSMRAGMWWRWQLVATKTAAGTAQPVFQVRIGANQTTADTSRLSITTAAQTADADTALITILVTCQSVSATGVLQGLVWIQHNLAATGFANTPAGFNLVEGTSAAFDNTTLGGQYLGLSINGVASAAWTINQVLGQYGVT